MRIKRIFTTIDTHTAGGPTRIITSGVPKLHGKNAAEKMEYFQNNLDSIRKLLLNEPRGHDEMYGAIIFDMEDPHIDIGAFFMTTNGYLPACVHSSIGVITATLKTGSLSLKSQKEEILMETPAGVISLQPNYQDEKLLSVSLKTKPAYVYDMSTIINIRGTSLSVSVVFSGVFFAIVDVSQLDKEINAEQLQEYISLGRVILTEINQSIDIIHPENPEFKDARLIMFYEQIGRYQAKVIVVGPMGNVDRSPCGAGTGALVAYQFAKGNLGIGNLYNTESIIGSQFSACVSHIANVGEYPGIVPQINGSAFITGFHQFVLEDDDPIEEGFKLYR